MRVQTLLEALYRYICPLFLIKTLLGNERSRSLAMVGEGSTNVKPLAVRRVSTNAHVNDEEWEATNAPFLTGHPYLVIVSLSP